VTVATGDPRCRRGWPAFAVVLLALWPQPLSAYTAAGDRTFPAMILLPQVAPADQFYVTPATVPVSDGRSSDLAINFAKLLTERLGIRFEEDYAWIRRNGASTLTGWQNLETVAQYLAVLDPPHEALLTLGFNREWGGTGAQRVGASPKGATAPTVYFAKGMGDLDIGYLRPLAAEGILGYQFADAPPRPDNLLTGITFEYSIPYLQSKVQSLDLPDFLRGMTPLVETFVITPTAHRGSDRINATIGPGFNYSGEGWEFTIEALIPASHAAGTGLGVTAQLNISLDFFLPDTIGKPVFSAH
jgi:hypothetical protein